MAGTINLTKVGFSQMNENLNLIVEENSDLRRLNINNLRVNETVGIDLQGSNEGEINPVNADTLGGVHASEYATVVNVNEKVRKAAPRNLLDNSDFRNPVNQRGQTSYTGNAYTIDRWQLSGGSAKLNVLDGHITLMSDTGNRYLFQKMPNPDNLLGKTFTIALKTAEGVLLCRSGALPESYPESGDDGFAIMSDTFGLRLRVYSAGYIRFEIRANAGNHVLSCVWAALYEGEYTAETLPEYQPKDYGVELLACQTQLQRFHTEAERKTYCEDFRPTMRMTPNGTVSKFEREIDGATYYFASAEL